MKAAFRVDSDKKIGLGHLNRCLTLANELKKKKVQITFFTKNQESADIIKQHNHKVIKIKNNEILTLKNNIKNYNVLIIDSKRKSVFKLIKKFRNTTKVVCIDNTSTTNVDLFILPGVKEQFSSYSKNALIGSKYVLLNPNMTSAKNYKRNNSILLSLGGSDKYYITTRFVKAFKKIKSDFKLIVILGKFNNQEKKIYSLIKDDNRFVLLKDPKNFHQLLTKSLLGIISFGITVYEVAACGLPSIVVSHTNENNVAAKKVEQYGWFKYLGKYDKINYFNEAQKIIQMSKNKNLLQKMRKRGKLIDFKGGKRVAHEICKLIKT